MPNFPQIPVRDLEVLMDAFAYLLATDSRTSNINWILGEPGTATSPPLPFGFIYVMSESVRWYTADGRGTGGLAAGLDDWDAPIIINVGFEPHRYPDPIAAVPPATSPFNQANNSGFAPPYLEAPGWRKAQQIAQSVKKVLRTNSTIGGAASDTHIVESRYFLQELNGASYRALRMTIQTQQRRTRGN